MNKYSRMMAIAVAAWQGTADCQQLSEVLSDCTPEEETEIRQAIAQHVTVVRKFFVPAAGRKAMSEVERAWRILSEVK